MKGLKELIRGTREIGQHGQRGNRSGIHRRDTPTARKALKQLRAAAAPGITERISYRVPTFDLDGRYLLYIAYTAAFKAHVSVYPVTAGMVARCGKEIAPYRAGKGTLRSPPRSRSST